MDLTSAKTKHQTYQTYHTSKYIYCLYSRPLLCAISNHRIHVAKPYPTASRASRHSYPNHYL
jgi:hypothetical protein